MTGTTAAEPSPKVTAAALAGAGTVIVVWLVGLAGVEVPPEVGSALTVLLMGGAGWLKRDHLRDVGAEALERQEATGSTRLTPPD